MATTPLATTSVDPVAVSSTTSTSVLVTQDTTASIEAPVLDVVIGRVTSVDRDNSFSAARIDPRRKGLAIGPLTMAVDERGPFLVPAGTVIDVQCAELDIALPGELLRPGDPCHVRVDVDEAGIVHSMWILTVTEEELSGRVSISVSGDVVGATATDVVIHDRIRDTDVEWLLAPGVVFECAPHEWIPPDYPTPPDRITYDLFLDIEDDTVTRLQCRGSF